MSTVSEKMSSQHQYVDGGSARPIEVDHSSQLAENLGKLCLAKEYSDVTLIVEGEKLHVHKVILASRSEFFRALFYCGMKETDQNEVELPNAPLKAFKALLQYIYTGHMLLSNMKEDVVLDVLGLANQYGFQELEKSICDHLRQVLTLKNVCAVLDSARLFDLKKLVDVCHEFLDKNAAHFLEHETLPQLSQAAFKEVLERDSFFAVEIAVFQGVCKWLQTNADPDNLVMNCVRLSVIPLVDLLGVVRPSGFVEPDRLLDAISEKINTESKSLPYRGQLLPEENVAFGEMGAAVIAGELRENLLDGDVLSYDMENGFPKHTIGTASEPDIKLELGTPSVINHIRMLLSEKELRSYSYIIEVSMENNKWVRVVDHMAYLCRSWQCLYFPAQVVKYIRIRGTLNTYNRIFHIASFEAMYKLQMPALLNGLVVPTQNVARIELGAAVREGVSRSRHALLNGNTSKYDWDNGYTCHQLCSGSILVQLGQPYVLSSMRMLLWDLDDRNYSYYIQVSVDMNEWEIVVDKTNDWCQSWQVIRFPPRPVVFIKIVGTRNTANEVFHCVHFECPSQDNEMNNSPTNAPTPNERSPSPEEREEKLS